MALFDLSLDELKRYSPPLTRRPDFENFWQETLAEAARQPLNPTLEQVDSNVPEVQAFAAGYDGWQGASIAAWYLLPPGQGPFPVLIFYPSYQNFKRGLYPYLPWVLQGYTVLAIDVRDQTGDSIDPTIYHSGSVRGWLTRGILDKYEYYYRGVYVDAVRALDFLAARKEVNMERVGLAGYSQGGGLALAAAALDHRPALVMANLPFLCHFERPLQVSRGYAYWELADYIRRRPDRTGQMFETLSYFDNLNLAGSIQCPTLVSVGLIDEICPPSTIFAVYNRLTGPKNIAVFPFHGHERPDPFWDMQIHWANHYLRGVAGPPELAS